MSSSWSASNRFGLVAAPGSLALVQDFLNTSGIDGYGPDLLSDTSRAQAWVAGAARAWSADRGADVKPPVLNSTDVPRLRALRETIANLIAGPPPADTDIGATATLALSATGRVQLEPTGRGWRWLASALWGEILLAQENGRWRRLKQCHNPGCRSTFYDRSKNNSGVWHNVKTCGNAANLRASRARRREAKTCDSD